MYMEDGALTQNVILIIDGKKDYKKKAVSYS